MVQPIPVSEPLLDGNEAQYLSECIETGWISSEGPFVQQFEEHMAVKAGRQYGIAVSSGSAALDVAVSALRIGAGDEVILPTFTIISCAASIVRAGAQPVVVDCDPQTWNMDVSQIENKITASTKAILVVHIYGLPVDMDPVMQLAEKYGLFIIEDAAEAHGQTYKNRPCGSFGAISIFSFYPNKNITTGEGGMVVTDDENLAERCRSLRNLCFQKQQRFIHEEWGWNYRMSNIQAALGLAQMERLDQFVKRKRHIGQYYSRLLRGVDNIELPLMKTNYAENVYWVYGIVLKEEVAFDAKEAMRRLGEHKIGTRPFFWPMHEQPVMKKMGFFANESCPVAERIARRGFYIPASLVLTDVQMERVSQSLKEILK
ncbi:MAG: DegT/DnrJ/EryC1/StrS family aminotransferase [SAR324 cluster bacterium]|nr:DegT/DnrJ/EryC1/StrS family aminotransferase [SAR324 cluster bacterium]